MAADKGIISNNLLKSASGSYYGINLVTGTNALCTGNLNLTDSTKLYNASPSGLVTHYQKLVVKDNLTDRLVVDATGALALNTNKFNIDASGNTDIAGYIKLGTTKFTVDTSGNTLVAGTLGVTGIGTFSDNIYIASGKALSLNGPTSTWKLTFATDRINIYCNDTVRGCFSASGLDITGMLIVSSTLGVTGTGTFSDNVYIASGKALSLNGSTSTWKLAFVTDRINIYCNDTVRGCFSTVGLDVTGALIVSSTINTATITSGSLSSTAVSGLNINHAHTGGVGGTVILADSINFGTGLTQNIFTTGTGRFDGTLQVNGASTLSSIITNTITGTSTFNLSTASNSSIVITSSGSGDVALYTNSKIFLRSANNYFDGSDRLYLGGFIYSADGKGISTSGTNLYFTNASTKGLQLNSTAIIPYGSTTLGSSAARWATVYGVNGDFSGGITAISLNLGGGNLTAGNEITCNKIIFATGKNFYYDSDFGVIMLDSYGITAYGSIKANSGFVSSSTYMSAISFMVAGTYVRAGGDIYTTGGNLSVVAGNKIMLEGVVGDSYIIYESGYIRIYKNNIVVAEW